MHITALLVPALAASVMAQPPSWWHGYRPSWAPSSSAASAAPATCTTAPVPASTCITDAAASSLAAAFSSMLTNVNRTAANVTGQAIIADGFNETSDSILSLEHLPLGGVTFSGKQVYLKNVVYAPPVGAIETLDIIHDCTTVVWYWVATGLGLNLYPAKGVNIFYTVNNGTQIIDNHVEFNSLAWGADIHNSAVNASTVQ